MGWSSWLAKAYLDHAEAGGGTLVAAVAILLLGAFHTASALRTRPIHGDPDGPVQGDPISAEQIAEDARS